MSFLFIDKIPLRALRYPEIPWLPWHHHLERPHVGSPGCSSTKLNIPATFLRCQTCELNHYELTRPDCLPAVYQKWLPLMVQKNHLAKCCLISWSTKVWPIIMWLSCQATQFLSSSNRCLEQRVCVCVRVRVCECWDTEVQVILMLSSQSQKLA